MHALSTRTRSTTTAHTAHALSSLSTHTKQTQCTLSTQAPQHATAQQQCTPWASCARSWASLAACRSSALTSGSVQHWSAWTASCAFVAAAATLASAASTPCNATDTASSSSCRTGHARRRAHGVAASPPVANQIKEGVQQAKKASNQQNHKSTTCPRPTT